MRGFFVASSGRMMGDYKERRYEYDVLQLDREDGTTVTEKEKNSIGTDDLQEADRVMFTVTGGHLGDEKAYRWVAGPFPTQGSLEEAIEDMMLYGSP